MATHYARRAKRRQANVEQHSTGIRTDSPVDVTAQAFRGTDLPS